MPGSYRRDLRTLRCVNEGGPTDVKVDGLVTPGWEAVADAFERNFSFGEVGAGCCISVDGAPVVDIVGGRAHAPSGRAWRHDTLAVVFSTTKGATAACANLLVARGTLGSRRPVG